MCPRGPAPKKKIYRHTVRLTNYLNAQGCRREGGVTGAIFPGPQLARASGGAPATERDC